jgi:hypothetical protein
MGGNRHFATSAAARLAKLEDRLRLLLQPPLESLLAAESLRFAAQPHISSTLPFFIRVLKPCS